MTTSTTTAPAEQVTGVQIVSVQPNKIEDNQHLVSWSRRSTAANPVDNANRYRGAIIPKHLLTIPDGSTTSKFSTLLQSTINNLADAKFQDYIKDRLNDTILPDGTITIDSVLAFWAEERQRSVINGESVTTWLKASETYKALDSKKQAVWLSKVPKIAAPSYANIISKGEAAAIIAKISDDDLESPVAQFVINRLNLILTAISQEDAF